MLSDTEILNIIRDGEREMVDFKVKHHECLAELVQDILCLANADGSGNRYLIYGVENSPPHNIVGLKSEDTRRTQDQIIMLLRDSNFNSLPLFKLYSVKIEGDDIDMLIIEDKPKKPYILLHDKICGVQNHSNHKGKTTQEKQKDKVIRAGVVYTRDASVNTATNSTASELQIYTMWEERFGLRHSPLSRIETYLCDTEGWKKTTNNTENQGSNCAYYKKFPEFTIESFTNLEPSDKFSERWHTSKCIRPYPHQLGMNTIALKYHTTILKTIALINVEYKRLFPVPINMGRSTGEAHISRDSLGLKVAAILDGSDFSDGCNLQTYTKGLEMFLLSNRPEFIIEVID